MLYGHYPRLHGRQELVRTGFWAFLREQVLHLCYANRSEFLKRAFSFYFNSILGHSIFLTPGFLSGKIGQTGKYIDIRSFPVEQPKPQTGRFLNTILIASLSITTQFSMVNIILVINTSKIYQSQASNCDVNNNCKNNKQHS